MQTTGQSMVMAQTKMDIRRERISRSVSATADMSTRRRVFATLMAAP